MDTPRETRQQIRERLGLPEPNREFWRTYVEDGPQACIGYPLSTPTPGYAKVNA
jgi:hypothetical protein